MLWEKPRTGKLNRCHLEFLNEKQDINIYKWAQILQNTAKYPVTLFQRNSKLISPLIHNFSRAEEMSVHSSNHGKYFPLEECAGTFIQLKGRGSNRFNGETVKYLFCLKLDKVAKSPQLIARMVGFSFCYCQSWIFFYLPAGECLIWTELLPLIVGYTFFKN